VLAQAGQPGLQGVLMDNLTSFDVLSAKEIMAMLRMAYEAEDMPLIEFIEGLLDELDREAQAAQSGSAD